MKSKLNFFGVCVLACTLILSLFSCTKDLEDQVNELKSQVSALQSAISAGKLVTQVNPVTGGYDVVFSDNSKITIKHGLDGTPGTPGKAGFTPILGIDADGYWTVITSEGGTPEFVKDKDGNKVSASLQDVLSLTDDLRLAINGVETDIVVPKIIFNEAENVLNIWAEDGNMYKVPLADNLLSKKDIVSLVAPIAQPKVLIQYGTVPAGYTTAQYTWIGLKKDDLIQSKGLLPVIVNPAAANIAGYGFDIINAKGDLFALQGVISKGFAGDFSQYAPGENGLYTLTLTPSIKQINDYIAAVPGGETTELAIRANKGEYDIVSPYSYSIKVKEADEQVLSEASVEKYVATGKQVDFVPLFTSDGTKKQAATNFYKTGVSIDKAVYANYLPFISYSDNSSVVSSVAGLDLNAKSLVYTLTTFDYKGLLKTRGVTLYYFTDLSANVPNAAPVSHTLTTVAADKVKYVDLNFLFTALDAAGKKDLWRTNAANLTLNAYNETTKKYDVPAVNKGITVEFVDNVNLVTGNVADIRKIKLTFNEAVAVPGPLDLQFAFEDAREGGLFPNGYPAADKATYPLFTFLVPVTISNPGAIPATDLATVVHTAGLWTSATELEVFGPEAGQTTNSVYYNLYRAYAAGMEATGKFTFEAVNDADKNADPAKNLIDANHKYLVQKLPGANTYATTYVQKDVKLVYNWFGNANNKQVVETIKVTAKSEIMEGKVVTKTETVGTVTKDKVLAITYGDLVTTEDFEDYFQFNNYYQRDLEVFVGLDPTVASVKVEVPAEYDNLIEVSAAAPYTVKSRPQSAPLVADQTVPVKVTVEDKFGYKKVVTVNVIVKKP